MKRLKTVRPRHADQVVKADSAVTPLSNSPTCYGCACKGHILKDCHDKRR